jgi:hypothetical protein
MAQESSYWLTFDFIFYKVMTHASKSSCILVVVFKSSTAEDFMLSPVRPKQTADEEISSHPK